jgi:hypothetical protein
LAGQGGSEPSEYPCRESASEARSSGERKGLSPNRAGRQARAGCGRGVRAGRAPAGGPDRKAVEAAAGEGESPVRGRAAGGGPDPE